MSSPNRASSPWRVASRYRSSTIAGRTQLGSGDSVRTGARVRGSRSASGSRRPVITTQRPSVDAATPVAPTGPPAPSSAPGGATSTPVTSRVAGLNRPRPLAAAGAADREDPVADPGRGPDLAGDRAGPAAHGLAPGQVDLGEAAAVDDRDRAVAGGGDQGDRRQRQVMVAAAGEQLGRRPQPGIAGRGRGAVPAAGQPGHPGQRGHRGDADDQPPARHHACGRVATRLGRSRHAARSGASAGCFAVG